MKSLRLIFDKYTPQSIRDLIGLLNKIIYRGNDYQCPICLSNLRLFYPLPDNFKVELEINNHIYTAYDFETLNVKNYQCPVCRCSDRERLYALYLKKRLNEFKGRKTIVHFSPERSLSNYFKKNQKYNYRTADLDMKGVDDNIDITHMDIYETNSVDCFICSHVLEHVPEDTRALTELFRILKPRGWGIVMVPIICDLDRIYENFSKASEAERLKHFGQEDHVRVYAKNDFLQKIENVGFTVLQLGVDYFGKAVFKKAAITEKSNLYVVEKINFL